MTSIVCTDTTIAANLITGRYAYTMRLLHEHDAIDGMEFVASGRLRVADNALEVTGNPIWFDVDGQMYVDTRFGDFPHWLPTRANQSSEELFTGWMLLSYRKSVTASSTRDSFPASTIADENPRTFWVAKQNQPGEWLTLDLGRVYDLKGIQVNYADYKSGLYGTDSTVFTQFRLKTSVDGREWRTVADLSQAKMQDTCLRGARYDVHTRWPKGFDPQKEGAVRDK